MSNLESNPDIIVFTGDLINKNYKLKWRFLKKFA